MTQDLNKGQFKAMPYNVSNKIKTKKRKIKRVTSVIYFKFFAIRSKYVNLSIQYFFFQVKR